MGSNLETVILNRCPGVQAFFVITFLASTGVQGRDNNSRLDRLSLREGCEGVTATELRVVDDCVWHDRDAKRPFSAGNFDLWPCVHCLNVIHEGLHCDLPRH